MKIRTAFATAGLAAALAVGAGTAAFAADDPASTGSTIPAAATATAPNPAKVAERCAKVPTALARIDTAQAKAEAHLTRLTDAQGKAETEGKAKRAERLGKAAARVQDRLGRLATAETKVQTWSTEHCPA